MQLLLMLVLVSAVVVHAAKLPDYISACSDKDPELDECILRQARAFKPMIVKGLKEFGLPSMDPLLVPLMQLSQGSSGGVDLEFNLTDTKNYGFKDMTVASVKADPKNHHYEFFLSFPRYTIIGNYVINGRILVLPITGSGFSNFTIDNVNASVVIDGKLEQRKGETYLKLTKVKCLLFYHKINVRMDNLFGNKQLSDTMNNFLNQNSEEAFADLKPTIEDIFTEIYTLFIGRIITKIPYNQLFKLN